MSSRKIRSAKEKLAMAGAALFLVGLFTGLWSALALTGKVSVQIPRLALAAHLNGLLGGLWLLGVAFTIDFLRYNERQLKILTVWMVVPTWANWLITLVASVIGVRGLEYTQDPSNNMIAALLQIGVVVPALIGSIYWVRGFFHTPPAS